MPGNPLPDAEQLLASLTDRMRPAVGPNTGLVGIYTGGVWLAERLHQALGLQLPLGTLDVSFYRDDFNKKGLRRNVKSSDIPFDIDGCDVIIVDDVLYTGRTIRAAVNELFDYGRPARVRLATLVDRGGRELPISADFSGADVSVGARRKHRTDTRSPGPASPETDPGLNMWLDPANPQLNKNGELHHLLSLEGLPADILRLDPRYCGILCRRHPARGQESTPAARQSSVQPVL